MNQLFFISPAGLWKFPEICLSIHTIYALHKTGLNHRQLNGQIPLIPLGLRTHYFTVHLGVCGKIKKVACSPSASSSSAYKKIVFPSLPYSKSGSHISEFFLFLPPLSLHPSLSPFSFPPFIPSFPHSFLPFFYCLGQKKNGNCNVLVSPTRKQIMAVNIKTRLKHNAKNITHCLLR